MSFGEFVTEWKKLKRQIRHKVSIGCKEGVPREQKSGWGREMWFNLPLLHTSDTSAWKRSWKSRRSFLCFISRLKIKNIQRKRSSECLYYSSRYFRCWKLHQVDHGGIFHGILNMCHNLSKNNKKTKFERINQREERRRSETKGDRWNQYKLPTKWKKTVSARYYQQRRPIFSVDWKSKDFQFPENKEVNISLEEIVFSSSGSVQRCDHEEADTRIAVYVLHALNKRHNQFLTQKQWTQTL